MCVLCGEFIMQVHWTDHDLEDQSHAKLTAGENQRDRRRNRIHRVQLANRILNHYGLTLHDWNGSKFVLKDRKGRAEIVHDLGVLWPAAEKLTNRPLDPLHPDLLASLAPMNQPNHVQGTDPL